MNQYRSLFNKLIPPILLLYALVFVGAVSAKTESSDAVHALLAGLSDEQVRQMLIDELRKETTPADSAVKLETEIDGPAAPLSRLLKSLDSGSVDFEHQFQNLLPWTPNIFPDLYKVFITL